jgi:hypothetical protein
MSTSSPNNVATPAQRRREQLARRTTRPSYSSSAIHAEFFGSSNTCRRARHAQQDRHTIRCGAPWATTHRTTHDLATSPCLAARALLAAASLPRTPLRCASRTRHAALVAPPTRPARRRPPPFLDQALIPSVGTAQVRAFPLLSPPLTLYSSHTRRELKVEDEQ